MAQQENQDQPKYLTHEDLNGALAAQKKEFAKLMQTMQDQNKQLIETLQSTLGPPPEKPIVPSRAEISEDTVELKKQIKVLMDRDKQREQSEKQMKTEKSLRDTLNKHGINSRADLALKYLQDQVSYDEDGQLVMKFEDITYPLAEAVSKFAQTDQGKFLADPKDVRGSGARSVPSSGFSPGSNAPNTAKDASGNTVFKNAKDLKQFVTGQLANENLASKF